MYTCISGETILFAYHVVFVPRYVDSGPVDDPGLLLGTVVWYRAGIVLTLGVVATLVVERDEVLGADSTHI